jgi:hypothetical protein
MDSELEKFSFDEHFEEITRWFTHWGLMSPKREMLSSNGIIVRDIACGFLYLTDSSMAFLDFYISNPKSKKEDRAKALSMITKNLIAWAKEYGVTNLLANSQIKTIQNLAVENGFQPYGLSLTFMKEL